MNSFLRPIRVKNCSEKQKGQVTLWSTVPLLENEIHFQKDLRRSYTHNCSNLRMTQMCFKYSMVINSVEFYLGWKGIKHWYKHINDIDGFQQCEWMSKGGKEFHHAKWKKLLSKVTFRIIPFTWPPGKNQNCRGGEQIGW